MTGAGGNTPVGSASTSPPTSGPGVPIGDESSSGMSGQASVDGPRWGRHATGPAGGSPTGPRTTIASGEDESVRRSLELENECATVLAGCGYRVQQNPSKADVAQARLHTGDLGRPSKNPDYLIEGHVFDCCSPTSPTKPVRNIWSDVKYKIDDEQTQRVVLNLHDWRGDMAALHRQFHDWPIDGLKELAALTRDGRIVQILPRYR